MVKINAKDLPVRRLSCQAAPGAVGVPSGTPLRVGAYGDARGTAPPTGRCIQDRTYDNLIQTDCAINPQPGGPLLDINGDAIGINTAILANAQGLGLPSLIGFARAWLTRYPLRQGEATWTGLYVRTLTPERRPAWDAPRPRALVVFVVPNSPAWRWPAAGDVILELDGQPVSNGDTLMLDRRSAWIGDRVELLVQRGGQQGRTELASAKPEVAQCRAPAPRRFHLASRLAADSSPAVRESVTRRCGPRRRYRSDAGAHRGETTICRSPWRPAGEDAMAGKVLAQCSTS